MIQRIQTIYLILTAVLTGLMMKFPIAIYYSGESEAFRYGVFGITPAGGGEMIQPGNWMIQLGLLIISTLLALYTIFRFKNRKLQLQLSRFNLLLLLALILSAYFSVRTQEHLQPVSEVQDLKTLYWIGFYLPVAAMAFQWLAIRGIKRDEELIKSIDRLRG